MSDQQGTSAYERCEVCGLGRHRFMFPGDGLRSDGGDHQPSAVACANGIIGKLEDLLRGRSWPAPAAERVYSAITDMGFAIDRLDSRTQDYVRGEVGGAA